MNDLLVVLIPLLAVFAGIGAGINFAMLQDEAAQDFVPAESAPKEVKVVKKSTRQLIEDEFEFEQMSD